MMQLKPMVSLRSMLVIGLMTVLSLGRVWASEPVAKPLSVKKNVPNAWQLKQSTFDGMEVRMTLGQISDLQAVDVPEQGRFLSLAIDGYTTVGEIGSPALPAYIQIIELPQGAEPVVEISRDKVEIVDLSAYGERIPLFPRQAPVSKGSKPAPAFAYNPQAYAAKGYQGQELVRVEIMGESRGVRLAKLIVSPVEYEPSQNRLRVHTDIAFEIRFEGADYNATQAKKRRYQSKGFQVAAHAGVNAGAFRLADRSAKALKVDEQPLRYAIVADPKFKDSLQGFIAWKRQQGYDVVAAYTDEDAVGNTNEMIRNYLKGLYDRATEAEPAPTYVLLVGDTKEIPPFASREKDPSTPNRMAEHISDLYYAEYTEDKLPDVYLGRFSATTVEELMPQIHKTMYMSRLAEEAAGFVDTTLLIAGNDSRYNTSHLNPALRYIDAYAAAEDGVASIFYPAPTSSTAAMEDEIITRISAGAGLICYTGHGMEYEWCEPKISNTVLRNKIFNKDKYPMMIGNCCLTGAFDYREPCFGEMLLRSVDKGAVVYIGGTNSSYFDEDFYWAVGLANIASSGNKTYTYENTGRGAMDCLYHTHGENFSDWAVTASDIIYKGNLSVEGSGSDLNNYYWEIYELFGDPTYRPYLKKPSPTPIDCERNIVVGVASLEVHTAPYAQLALYGKEGLVAVVSADAEGEASVPTIDIGVGEYTLYAGAAGYSDQVVKITAAMPQGKFIFVESLALFDGDAAVTTGLYGKRYDVSLKLKNLGTEAVNSLQVKITSDDEYLVAGEAYTYSEVSEPESELALDKKVYFTIDPNVPDRHYLRYKVELTLDGAAEPITRNFRLIVGASDLQLVWAEIDDSGSATPDGILESGETVKVSLAIHNNGSAEARSVKAVFESEKDYLIFPEPADWGTIMPGDTLKQEFVLSAKAGHPRYDVYTVVCKMEADAREEQVEFSSYIDPTVETFETGDFSFVAWDTASDWVISDSAAHGGKFCAASAYIGNRDTSRLRLKVNVPLDDVVGFYYRTSTEGVTASVGDFLVFLIDGELQGRWNRETPWTYVSYPVSAGEHTLEWLYVKDNSDAALADRVWIDDVRLPIGSHEPMTPNECVSTLSAAGEPLFTVVGSAAEALNLHFKAVKAGSGRLYLLNMLGEHVRTLANGLQLAEGESDFSFPVSGLKPGVYVCVFEGADGRSAVKFIKR